MTKCKWCGEKSMVNKHGYCEKCNESLRVDIGKHKDTLLSLAKTATPFLPDDEKNRIYKEMKDSYAALLSYKKKKVAFLKSDPETLKRDVLTNLGMPMESAPKDATSNKKATGCGCLVLIVVIFALAIAIRSCSSDPPANQAVLDAEAFSTRAKAELDKIDTMDALGKVDIRVSDNYAHVDIYLSNTASWDATSETDQKELINNLAKMMDAVAVISIAPSEESTTGEVGAFTTLYTPGGVKLGERTLTGKIKIE